MKTAGRGKAPMICTPFLWELLSFYVGQIEHCIARLPEARP